MLNTSEFEKRYKELNPKQKEAVDSIEGPVLVIAGPGTGKTTILTLRIAQILQKTDTPAHGILAITYTDAGVKAMREKLREVMGNRAHDVAIHTFHSFASAMVAEYPGHFMARSDFRIMTDIEVESMLREILTAPEFFLLRPLGRPDAYISSIIRGISDTKKEALTSDEVEKYAKNKIEEIKNDRSSISDRGASKGNFKAVVLEQIEKLEKTILFAKVFSEYEKAKGKNKLQDYDDLIINFLVALRTDELFLRLIQERFLYILVDEHQDTNDSQNFILGLISEFFETPNLFIVGDEKQAIYRFQGASVENFLSLRKRYPDMKIISLNTNYRSTQAILDASFKMIENNYALDEHKELRIQLKSGQKQKHKPLEIIIAENALAMEEYLVEAIKNIPESQTIGIITRRNRELERILRVLDSAGIPVSSERSIDIFHHPIGALFFDLIQYITEPSKIESLALTIAAGLWGFNWSAGVLAIRNLKSGKVPEIRALQKIQKILIDDSALGALIAVADESGLTGLIASDPAYVAVWRGIVTLAESISRDGNISNPRELIADLLNYRQSAEMKPVKVSVGAPDFPIKAMTAHGSKGLEFDYVFISYVNEEMWVGRNHGSSFILPTKSNTNEISDIRRLFYVALTRARKHVTMLYANEESDGKRLTPLRFLNELHPDRVVKVPVKSLHDIKISIKHKQGQSLLIEEAKQVLSKSGLSVTALNHYMECPNKFLYESILRLPQAPTLSSEKGNAMHQALHAVWLAKNPDIEKIIIEKTTEYINQTLLSVSDKEALKKELIEDGPAVAKALAPHFSTKGKVFSEKKIQTYWNNTILRGNLDVIIDLGDKVLVFDYKTRQAMSSNKIKSGDKNYFRQLVFYKMLLNNDSQFRDKSVETSLIFVSPDDNGRCPTVTIPVSVEDIKEVEKEIQTLIDDVWNGTIADKFCADINCRYCGFRKLLRE